MTQPNTLKFCIIGAGCNGLMTALHLRKNHKDAIITIFDSNKNLSPTVNGGNGMLHFDMNFPIKDINSAFYINKQSIYKDPSKLFFYLIHTLEYIFNNKKNRTMVKKIAVEDEDEVECDEEKSDYYRKNYWDNLTEKLISQNVEIKDRIDIIDYKYNNDNIILLSKTGESYTCDKLILCTSTNLKLIKNKYYHQYIDSFSGYSAIIEIKNTPKCFYFRDDIFITPYDETHIKITFILEVGYNDGNYYIDINNPNYNRLAYYIKNNNELQRLGFISIKNIWRGARAMTYDIIPFIKQIDNNVYWLTGGSYMGTHMAFNFGKWMAEMVDNKTLTPLNDNIKFDPTLKRLENIKKKYSYIIIFLLTFLLLIVNYFS